MAVVWRRKLCSGGGVCVVCGVWCVMCVCVSASYPAAKQRNKEHQSKLGHTEPLPRGWPSPMLTFAGRLGAAGPAPSSAFASAAGLSVAVAVAVGATQERVRERRRMSTSRKRTQPSYTARRRYTGATRAIVEAGTSVQCVPRWWPRVCAEGRCGQRARGGVADNED